MGQNWGVVFFFDVLKVVEDVGFDFVEILLNVIFFVCKIFDYGKFCFLEQKKVVEVCKKQKMVEVKEIKLCFGIDDYDYEVKMKVMKGFFEEGNKVKIILCFCGCEMVYQFFGLKVLDWVKFDVGDIVKVEMELNFEGCQVVMVLVLC